MARDALRCCHRAKLTDLGHVNRAACPRKLSSAIGDLKPAAASFELSLHEFDDRKVERKGFRASERGSTFAHAAQIANSLTATSVHSYTGPCRHTVA